MSEAITVALITGFISLFGTVLTVYATQRKQAAELKMVHDKQAEELKTAIAIINKDIEELTRETREHNEFARRVPLLEVQFKNAEKRLERLEQKEE